MTGARTSVVVDGTGQRGSARDVNRKRLGALVWSKRAWLGFLLAVLAIYLGWTGRHERNISAEDGLGYAMGILGASMMAALLIYPLRKRLKSLKVLGATRHWFRIHMILGIVGPVLILYHSNFTVSSLNSRVALFCTLLVAGSGLVGRYLYSKIHNGLYGKKTSMRSLVRDMQQSMDELSDSECPTRALRTKLVALDNAVLETPATLGGSLIRPFRFAVMTRVTYWRLKRDYKPSPETRRDLRRHLGQVRRIAHLSFFERLFSLWHVLHLPFFFMLVISAVVHILAVHMY